MGFGGVSGSALEGRNDSFLMASRDLRIVYGAKWIARMVTIACTLHLRLRT